MLCLVLFIYYIFKLISFAHGGVITLIKENNITCVSTEHTVNSPVYITPFIKYGYKNEETQTINWNAGDWKIGNSEKLNFSFVADRRWELRKGFYIANNPISFSLCSTIGFKCNVSSVDYDQSNEIQLFDGQNKTLKSSQECEWSHYTMVKKNRTLFILNDKNETNTYTFKFEPSFFVKNNASDVIKLHRYNFKVSTETSISTASYFFFHSTKNICLTMYVSLDEQCYLKVIIETKSQILTKIFDGFNPKGGFRKWKEVKIKTNITENGSVFLYRGRYDNQTEGFWAVDGFKFCRPDISIYKTVRTDSDNHICKSLENANPLTFCEKPGLIGENCTITCEKILGKEYPYCEKYKICLDSEHCQCSWGYRGPNCQEVCKNGSWGLDCKNSCPSHCEICHHIKGCIKYKKNAVLLRWPPTILLPMQNDTLTFILESSNVKKYDFIVPEYYQVQYKEVTETFFKNYSHPKGLTKNDDNINITGLDLRSKNYSVRIVLIAKNQSYIDGVPEVLTQEDIFDVVCENNSIIISDWKYPSDSNDVYFEYECSAENSVEKKVTVSRIRTFDDKVCLNYSVNMYDFYAVTKKMYIKRKISGTCNSTLTSNYELRGNDTAGSENSTTFLVPSFPQLPLTNDTLTIGMESNASIYKVGNMKPEFFQLQYKDVFLYLLICLVVLFAIIIFGLMYFLLKKRNKENRYIFYGEKAIDLIPMTCQNESTRIDLTLFKDYVLNLKETTLRNQLDSFSEGQGLGTTVTALRPQSINKNEDQNRIVPYDQNRVILNPMEGVGQGDYIDASYIDGYERERAYIACQGPKYHTVCDFWRMIWQQNVETIIMVNNLTENKQRICAEYWSENVNDVFECGKMLIKLISETNYEFYVCRKFQIYYDKVTREVLQFQLKWNISEYFYPNSALPVVKAVREIYKKSSSPILVHSRTGTNRTAVVILCDMALKMIETEKQIDIFTLAKQLIQQYPFFIDNVTYYLLVHLIVSEYLLEENSPFKNNLNKINEKLEYLQLLCQHDSMIQKYIPVTVKHYFSHTWIPRYGNNKKYLITKVPNEEEVGEFWKMVSAEPISSIIFLNEKLPRTTSNIISSSEIIEVDYIDEKQTIYYKLTAISLLRAKLPNKKIYKRQINILELKDWNPKRQLPKSKGTFIRMLNEIHRIESEDHILVGCSDGFTASGLFVVLSYILEKYEKELDVDVCNAVRIARRSGKKFINKTQLKFIDCCINEYIQNYYKYQLIQEA